MVTAVSKKNLKKLYPIFLRKEANLTFFETDDLKNGRFDSKDVQFDFKCVKLA